MTYTPELSLENQLLLCVARRSIDDATSHKIRGLLNHGELDWNYLFTTAVAHGVAALLAYHLKSVAGDLVPSAVLAELQLRNQRCVEEYLFLTGQLAKIVGALADNDIPCIAFKGPTLAMVAYGDVALRQFADLDILVHKHHLPHVKEILTREGFVPFSVLDAGREAGLLRFDNAYAFTNDQAVIVDVHWRFAPLYFSLWLETKEVWERAQPLEIAGRTVTTLSAEDLLLVLCCHGFTHEWQRLVWICDVASLVEARNLDWDYVIAQAKRLGVLRIVLVGLLLAREAGASLPAQVSHLLETDRVARSVAGQIRSQLLETQQNPVGRSQWLASQLSMRERMRDKAKALWRLVLTPRAYDVTYASVPRPFFFLYYLVRPIRSAHTMGGQL